MPIFTSVALIVATVCSSASAAICAGVALIKRPARRTLPWLWWLTVLAAGVSGYIALVYWRMILGLTPLDFGAAVLIRPAASIVFVIIPALVVVVWSRLK